jgi:hypothetical protein
MSDNRSITRYVALVVNGLLIAILVAAELL